METSTTTVIDLFDTATKVIGVTEEEVYQDTSMVKLPKLKNSSKKLFSDSNDSMLNSIRERMLEK